MMQNSSPLRRPHDPQQSIVDNLEAIISKYSFLQDDKRIINLFKIIKIKENNWEAWRLAEWHLLIFIYDTFKRIARLGNPVRLS